MHFARGASVLNDRSVRAEAVVIEQRAVVLGDPDDTSVVGHQVPPAAVIAGSRLGDGEAAFGPPACFVVLTHSDYLLGTDVPPADHRTGQRTYVRNLRRQPDNTFLN